MAKYTEEQTAQIKGFIESFEGVIPYDKFLDFLGTFDVSEKSLASKIRFMGGKIEGKPQVVKEKMFSPEDEQVIREMCANPNDMPYLEDIAERLGKGEKQVRGKLVSMRIKGVKKRNVKVPAPKAFSDEEEAVIKEMCADPDNMPFIEDIAEKLGRTKNQIRGKLASMRVKGVKSKETKEPKPKVYTDELKEELRELVKSHTIEQIAEMKNLNLFGLRSILGKMGLIEKKVKQVYWTDERVKELQGYLEKGMSVKEIADRMSKNPLVIAKKVKQLQKVEETDAEVDFDSVSV